MIEQRLDRSKNLGARAAASKETAPAAVSSRRCPSSRIAAVGSYLPPRELLSVDIERRLRVEAPPGWIEEITGVRARRVAEPGTPGSELAALAVLDMLDRSRWSLNDIDCIIVGSATADCIEPCTANMVQSRLGARGAAFDVGNACNGFLSALQVADALVTTGQFGCVAVACGESLAPFVPWHLAEASVDPLEYIGSITLGDGGGAALVVPSAGDGRGLLASSFVTEGDMWEAAIIRSGGSRYPGASNGNWFTCQARPLYDAAYRLLPDMIEDVLGRAGWQADDVDLIVPHQVSISAVANIGCRFGWTVEDAVFTLTDCGNTAAASMPMALARAAEQERLDAGSHVLMVGAAAGFSAGVTALRW